MSTKCLEIQERLAELGVESLSASDREHIESCAECAAFASALAEVDAILPTLPEHEPAAGLVARTVQSVKKRETRTTRRFPVWQTLHLPSPRALAVALTLVLAVVFSLSKGVQGPLSKSATTVTAGGAGREEQAGEQAEEQYMDLTSNFAEQLDDLKRDERQRRQTLNELGAKVEEHKERNAKVFEALVDRVDALSEQIDRLPRAPQQEAPAPARSNSATDKFSVADSFDAEARLSKNPPAAKDAIRLESGVNTPVTGMEYPVPFQLAGFAESTLELLNIAELANAKKEKQQPKQVGSVGARPMPSEPSVSLADKLGFSRAITPQLRFQDPSGYWANTYLPGSPREEHLASVLRGGSLAALEARSGRSLRLHSLAESPSQPFGIPAHSALGIQVSADRRHVEGESRLLVQVGIQAAERSAGRRAPLNLQVVLHLEHAESKDVQKMVRAVLEELSKNVEVGERFQLSISGTKREDWLKAEAFRWGPIQLALEKAFAPGDSGPSLEETYRNALESALGADTPNAPLGSSSIMIVTDAEKLPERLEQLAAKGAAGAVSTSVLALGEEHPGLDEVALDGHGRKLVLHRASEAKPVVERELAASSRAVARAVRLRLRLEPGVKLVDVIGSYRLQPEAATVEKAAEATIDRRIAESIGIEADRGEDENGIQILIPAFYSGDSHVILLDVVVPGPGKVLDVQARFKDLTELKNATLSASFATERSGTEPTALEQNVIRNFHAAQLARSLDFASQLVRGASIDLAQELLRTQAAFILRSRSENPGLYRDQSLSADLEMLTEYDLTLELLKNGGGETGSIADSLELAALRKRI